MCTISDDQVQRGRGLGRPRGGGRVMPSGRPWRFMGAAVCAAITLSVLPSADALANVRSGSLGAPSAAGAGSEGSDDSATGTAVTEADAVAQAKRSGHLVEITSLRSESGEVFAGPDGKL